MKEAEGRIDYTPHQMVLYVEKDDGSYGPLQTGSYMSKNYIDDFWKKHGHVEEEALTQLTKGTISPVGYFMLLLDMTASDVARRAGVSVRKVKKHRTPEGFGRIEAAALKRYADVFGVPMASLFCVTEQGEGRARTTYRQTSNPYVAIAEIDKARV